MQRRRLQARRARWASKRLAFLFEERRRGALPVRVERSLWAAAGRPARFSPRLCPSPQSVASRVGSCPLTCRVLCYLWESSSEVAPVASKSFSTELKDINSWAPENASPSPTLTVSARLSVRPRVRQAPHTPLATPTPNGPQRPFTPWPFDVFCALESRLWRWRSIYGVAASGSLTTYMEYMPQ